MTAIRHLWTHHRVVFLVFLAALAVTMFFAVRLVLFTIYWADPAHRNQTPEPWMTPGYIANSWGIDPLDLVTALDIEPGTRPTLDDIARQRGVPVTDLIDQIIRLLPDPPVPDTTQ